MLKKVCSLLIVIFLLGFVSSYTAPTYNDVQIELCSGYTAPSYNDIQIELGVSDSCGTVDSCTAPGSGEWALFCSDNCVLDAPQTVPANLNFSNMTGPGVVNISAKLTFPNSNQYIFVDRGCTINIFSGGSFN